MKAKTVLFLVIMFLCFNSKSYSQCDCSEALSSDLLNISREYNEAQFRDFLYEYFKASKKERRAMKRDYSNSFGLKAVVENLPIEFSSSSNSSRDSKEFYAFEQEVLKNKYVSNEIINSISTRYFSDNQLKAYVACLENNCANNNGVSTEQGGDPFDVFYVRIIFNNSVQDSKITLKSDVQYSGCSPVYGLMMRKGMELKSGQDLVQYFKRNNSDKVATVSVNFENGISAPPVTLEKKDIQSTLPIGTIVASTLTFSEFQSQMTDKAFKVDESIWAPCDGRSVHGSLYSTRYQKDFVPDLRGQFLRGNYTMGGPSEPSLATPNGENPRDGEISKNGYTYQSDTIKSHFHTANMNLGAEPLGAGARSSKAAGSHGAISPDWTSSGLVNSYGGHETRPKNIYVFYYIRIN